MADESNEMEPMDETETVDFFDHEPSKVEKLEMRKANKPPSEWLKLLCKEWAAENAAIVEATDGKFLDYKAYMKGVLSPQLLCRLSIPPSKDDEAAATAPVTDFWGILGVDDEFDKSYIVAQVERFCNLYNIRGPVDEDEGLFDSMDTAAAAAAGISVSPSGGIVLPSYMPGMDSGAVGAAAAAAAAAAADVTMKKKQTADINKAHRLAKDAERAMEQERRHSIKKEQRRLSQERKDQKAREREQMAIRKAAERAAREATREERRRKKLEIREQREKFQQEQKDAAFKRAEDLVRSNRVPIEITRGAAAAKAAAHAAVAASGTPVSAAEEPPKQKRRSCIIVSTAGDLNRIVTHSKQLWSKYNAIAKEHNQKVNWATVAKELGINVKVREKYARMHNRAEQRGFDWERDAHFRIKDYPQIFNEPTAAEQRAKMPPPPPDVSTTVLIGESKDDVQQAAEDAVAAAAAVVDASVEGVVPTSEEQTAAAAAVAATMVADPTAALGVGETTHV